MKYFNYTFIGTNGSGLKPLDTHLFIETNSSGTLYMVPSTATDSWYKSTDKGLTFSKINVTDNNNRIRGAFFDRINDRLYYCEGDTGELNAFWRYIDLTDDSITTIYSPIVVSFNYRTGMDVLKDGATTYCVFSIEIGPDNVRMGVYDLGTAWLGNIGTIGGRDYDYSYMVDTEGAYLWFVFEWDGGVDAGSTIWRWTKGTHTYTKFSNAGATMNLPTKDQRAIAYDGNDTLYFVLQDTDDSKFYLYTYEISTDTLTKRGEYNIALMLDRNTVSGTLEKAFHLTEDKIYQIQKNTTQLYLIAIPDSDAVFTGITDNFLINADGDIWEFEDQISLISSALLDHEAGEASKGIVTLLKGSILITKNMIMQFYLNYTTATATSEEIVFEGLITNFTEEVLQSITLISPAKKEIKVILPVGDFTKDTDGLILQLIIDNNNYITEGTLSDGGDLGTIALGGVLTEETIFDGCAKFDGFIWYFDPTGQLFYNNGTVDSGVDYTQTNALSGVNISHVHEEYNKIKVRGGYVDGVQVESAWQEDLESQQEFGINERIFLISFLNTVALCNTAASNILTILAKDPLRVKFTIKDTTKGYIQVGETITFEYAASGKTVASDQFIITSATINKYGDVRYTIASELS